MPLSPYTWLIDDFLTASKLNAELYRTSGLFFTPNGIGFHANRPVYFSGLTSTTLPSLPSATWTPIGKFDAAHANNAVVHADTAAMFGSRMDPGCNATAFLSTPNSGGVSGSAGGLGLLSTFIPMSTGSATVRAGTGPWNGAGPAGTGTGQQSNSGNVVTPWCVDIVDLGQATGTAQTGFGINNQASPSFAGNSTDSSGRVPRLGCHWCSVYPANGTTIGSLPSPKTDWTNVNLTASILNGSSGLVPLMNLLNMPPLLRVVSSATTSVPTGTTTVINFPAATYDTYGAWSSSTDTYTVPLSGLYLIAGFVPYDSGTGNSNTRCGPQINGTNFWGPANQGATAFSASGKVGIFDLQAGDTIKLVTQQFVGTTQNTSSSANSLFVVLYVGATGAPASLPSLPDVTFNWQAGTPNPLSLFNAHVANDLLFLNQRPYLLSNQAVSQTYTAGSDFTVTMDTISGVVHSTAGDPWSGWDSVNKRWVAPRDGWYLVTYEVFLSQPNVTTGVAAAKFTTNNAGNSSADTYQIQNMLTGANPAGASALGYYYLRSGDWIQPLANQSAGTTGLTTNVTGVNSHFEAVWMSE